MACWLSIFSSASASEGISGNIYKARVSRVLPGMQAAFVDLGPTVERKAYLYVGDILGAGDERRLLEGYDGGDDEDDDADDDAAESSGDAADAEADSGEGGGKRKKTRRKTRRTLSPGRRRKSQTQQTRKIEELIKEGQEIVVQIVKEPVGQKGARVTGYVSLPGRHCVLMPTVDKVGVSHRIASEAERKRLRTIVDSARPKEAGFIVRTAAEGADEQEIRDDVDYLVKLWDRDRCRRARTPARRRCSTPTSTWSCAACATCCATTSRRCCTTARSSAPARAASPTRSCPSTSSASRCTPAAPPLFDALGIEEALRAAIVRRVPLKSGGSLVIDQGEALTAIDVNTGSFVGKNDLEQTITKNNLEACEEVARQLRLRNIGGIIVVDFVDMDKESNRKTVWQAFQKALAKDSTRCNVTKISELGLVEMTRKRTRESLVQMLTEPCPTCVGRGIVKSTTTLAYEILREVRRVGATVKTDRILVECPPLVAELLDRYERDLPRRAREAVPEEGRHQVVELDAGGPVQGRGPGGQGGGAGLGRRQGWTQRRRAAQAQPRAARRTRRRWRRRRRSARGRERRRGQCRGRRG